MVFLSENVKRIMMTPDIHSVHLRLTNNCPVECQHCYARSTKSENSSMSMETVNDILVFLNHFDNVKITLTGGEPAAHPLFLEIVSKVCHFITEKQDESSIQIESSGTIQRLVQDGGNFQATYTRSRASMNAFPSRSLGTRINRFSRSQAPAWECMPRSSASSGLEISAILH